MALPKFCLLDDLPVAAINRSLLSLG